MMKEEEEMRRQGVQPSKEWLDKRKRLQKQKFQKQREAYRERQKKSQGLYHEQDRYLENIAEINKINASLGMP